MPVYKGNIIVGGHDYRMRSDNKYIDWVLLSASGHRDCAGVFWFKEYLNW